MNENYTVAEYVNLPSQGKIYGENISGRVKIRNMTTAEEMRRLSPCDHPYENICSIIDDCLVENNGISSYDMCMADYTKLLYALRTVTYGNKYPVFAKCPLCSSHNQGDLNLDTLTVIFNEDDINKYKVFELPITKKRIEIKFQTPRMLDQINDKIKEFKRKTQDRSIDSTLLFSLEQLIVSIDGQRVDSVRKDEWLRTLPMGDTNTIWQYSEKLEESLRIDRELDIVCDVCGFSYKSNLAITKEFFRPALNI